MQDSSLTEPVGTAWLQTEAGSGVGGCPVSCPKNSNITQANFYCRPHPPHTPCVVQRLLRYCSHTDRQRLHNKEGPGLFDKDDYPVDMLEQKQPLPSAHHGLVNQL